MFNINEYLSELTVLQDDDELVKALEILHLDELLYEDAWLCRQGHYGVAGAMERQIEYLGETLIPNAEDKISRMESKGVIGESYTQDSWFGSSNEDDPHINDEISYDQQIEEQKNFLDGLVARQRTAAIVFVTRVRAHDELSNTLDQLTYGGIKAKAAANREARLKNTG